MGKTFDNLCEEISSLRLNTKEVLTQKECSLYTGYSMQTLYGLVAAKQIPHSKRGARTFFKRSEIDEWLLSHKVYTDEENEERAEQYVANRQGIKIRRANA